MVLTSNTIRLNALSTLYEGVALGSTVDYLWADSQWMDLFSHSEASGMFSGNHKFRSGAGQREVHLQSALCYSPSHWQPTQWSKPSETHFQPDFFEHLFHSVGGHVLCEVYFPIHCFRPLVLCLFQFSYLPFLIRNDPPNPEASCDI